MKTLKADPTPICAHCINRIKDYGFICFDIMDSVCRNTLSCDISYYDDSYDSEKNKPVIKFLESKNYLITTEIDELMVVIRPNLDHGSFDEQAREFCWCKSKTKL